MSVLEVNSFSSVNEATARGFVGDKIAEYQLERSKYAYTNPLERVY